MSYERIPLEDFAKVFGSTSTELSSAALGGKVLSVSDEFFAEASNLLKVAPSVSLKGQFGPKGSLFDGWETRRHNPAHDWCIIKLGAPGRILGFDIDTAHFNGNEAPAASVQALYTTSDAEPTANDEGWTEILPKANLGPNSRHLLRIPLTEKPYTHVKLNQYPDGGIGRFRVYGEVEPTFPHDTKVPIDLAFVLHGGRVVYTSDAHFSSAANLLLPGRGTDMRDGWETKRSRTPGHKVWTIIKLGAPGYLQAAELDTAFFLGNFPESAGLEAAYSEEIIPHEAKTEWVEVLPKTKMDADRNHIFQLENTAGKVFTHVKVTMYPDGGMKRVRIIGKRAVTNVHTNGAALKASETVPLVQQPSKSQTVRHVPAVPLTAEAFAPFGNVIMAWADPKSAPKGTRYSQQNQGSAIKYHNLTEIKSSYPAGSGAVTGVSLFRSTPKGATPGSDWPVLFLERHPYTNQGFIPMGTGTIPGYGEEPLPPNRLYLVIVAYGGKDDRPDLSTLQAFVATTAQGIVYDQGTWHHPMVAMESTIDFACVETQTSTPGNPLDCELLKVGDGETLYVVQVPKI